jgi:(E)-4-hydroxy-3-methylbut-2-enyl-diphosphate synthase
MGEEGLLRSACGIGTLLMEGIGDTIRVSLTGDPVREVPAAREILKVAGRLRGERAAAGTPPPPGDRVAAPLAVGPVSLGEAAPLAVLAAPSPGTAAARGENGGTPVEGEPDLVLLRPGTDIAPWRAAGRGVVLWAGGPEEIPALAGSGADAVAFDFPPGGGEAWRAADEALARAKKVPVVRLTGPAGPADLERRLDDLLRAMPEATAGGAVIGAGEGAPIDTAPALERALAARRLDWIHMLTWYGASRTLPALMALSPPLLAGTAGLLFPTPGAGGETGVGTAWHVLQATRRRITHVEYISCPSCGRTLFDLEEVTTRIRKRTSHLKDVKIAVMGCIVNGPGEMADADFGYVGSGPGKIDLYVGRDRVSRNIPEADSVDRLVELIREKGAWTEPAEAG